MSFTTLIPAYKSEFLIQLLTCLRRQSLKPRRIIFSDDSPNQNFFKIINSDPVKTKIADLPIEVIKGPGKGGAENIRHLLNFYSQEANSASNYFHILMDDDLIYPTFYEQHIKAYKKNNGTKCVVSRRWLTVSDSEPAKDAALPATIADYPDIFQPLDASQLFSLTVGKGVNWIGEFSNATFAMEMASELSESVYIGIPYLGLEDLGAFLRAGLLAPIVFINQHLGIFRKSQGNSSSNPQGIPFKRALLAWFGLAIIGKRLGVLNNDQYLYSLAHRKANLLDHYQRNYKNDQEMRNTVDIICSIPLNSTEFELIFLDAWDNFLNINGSELTRRTEMH